MTTERIRRVVTGHDAAGRAVVTADSRLEGTANAAGSSRLTLLWTTRGLPVDNDDQADGRDRSVGLTNPGGSVLRIVDLLPGRSAPMHRTSSLDYGIVIAGTVELLLDDDAVTVIQAGDVVVQRAPSTGGATPAPKRPPGSRSSCWMPLRRRWTAHPCPISTRLGQARVLARIRMAPARGVRRDRAGASGPV